MDQRNSITMVYFTVEFKIRSLRGCIVLVPSFQDNICICKALKRLIILRQRVEIFINRLSHSRSTSGAPFSKPTNLETQMENTSCQVAIKSDPRTRRFGPTGLTSYSILLSHNKNGLSQSTGCWPRISH